MRRDVFCSLVVLLLLFDSARWVGVKGGLLRKVAVQTLGSSQVYAKQYTLFCCSVVFASQLLASWSGGATSFPFPKTKERREALQNLKRG